MEIFRNPNRGSEASAVVELGQDFGSRRYSIAVIDPRALNRECLLRVLLAQSREIEVAGFSSVEEWQADPRKNESFDAVLYIAGFVGLPSDRMRETLGRLVESSSPVPVILVAESDDLTSILELMACGVRGCIPASLNVDLLLEAIRVTANGGILLSAESLRSLIVHFSAAASAAAPHVPILGLTSRQAEVAEALRRGKSNKVIAHELGMCENTVKVHVRTIMKKLNAMNRTEAAFMLNAEGEAAIRRVTS